MERFRGWLVDKVVDLEVASGTASPTVEPGVRVVLVGHSMGGIVAAESVLGVVGEDVVGVEKGEDGGEASSGKKTEESSAAEPPLPPDPGQSTLFFPRIQAVLAFDTPYLGISPGVLAHGAEERFNSASSAYKAYTNASSIFGWKSPRSSSPAPPQQVPGASSKGLPPADGSTAGRSWGKYAMYGGAAAAIAAAGGAAYMNWNKIDMGMKWAGSHLEFVGCLARGAELQKRVERMVALRKSHGIGFANFYGALGKKTEDSTKYAGAVVGADRTFCVVPKSTKPAPLGSKRSSSYSTKEDVPRKRRKSSTADVEGMEAEMSHGEQVAQFAEDASKSKGHWVKCVNEAAVDELKAHTSFFVPKQNPGYHGMVSSARDWVVSIVEGSGWIEQNADDEQGDGGEKSAETAAVAEAGEN